MSSAYRVCQHWLPAAVVFLVLYTGLPFLAPIFMQAGWETAGRAIYLVYSFLCHQLPQRSFFLFGPQISYSLAEMPIGLAGAYDLMTLRQFSGNASMGWKVAWSDRMVWMFSSMVWFGAAWPIIRRFRRLSWFGLGLLLMPLALDGASHLISDLAGIGQGFRDTNIWLAALTGSTFGGSFYSGDAWGSFNALMRMATGLLFGFAIVWFIFPYFEEIFSEQAAIYQYKLQKAGVDL